MAISNYYFTYDRNYSARQVLLKLAKDYGVTVIDMNDSVITKSEITAIMTAERQAMYDANPDEFAAMDWYEFQNTLERHRLKYIDLLNSLSHIARAEHRDILTKAAVESRRCKITYQRLDGQILDYEIWPWEYATRFTGGDLIRTHVAGRGHRDFLVMSIISLEFLPKVTFPPWPDLPVHMTSYYNANNLSDLVIPSKDKPEEVPEEIVDPEDIIQMTFQEWLVWLPDQTFEAKGTTYQFVGLYHFLDTFLNIFHDLIDAVVDWGRAENHYGAGYWVPVQNKLNIYLEYVHLYSIWSMGVPELGYLHVGPELWDAIINHTIFLDAVPDLADHEWACAMIVYAYDPYSYSYGGTPEWEFYVKDTAAGSNRDDLSKDTARVITGLTNYFKKSLDKSGNGLFDL